MKYLKSINEEVAVGQIVYVVTNVENGWDCVSGVYIDLKDAVEKCDGEYEVGLPAYSYDVYPYVIHEKTLK